MSINLARSIQNSIQKKVSFTNDYFKGIWQNYERVMMIRRKNSKLNQPRFEQILKNVSPRDSKQPSLGYLIDLKGNPYDPNSGKYVFPRLLSAENNSFDGFELDNTVVDDDSMINFRHSCNQKRHNWFNGYRSVLYTTIHYELVDHYGKGIPKGLADHLDFSAIYRDASQVFTSLDRWWDAYGNGQDIQTYTERKNHSLLEQAHKDYDKGARTWLGVTIKANPFQKASKKVIRFKKGGFDDGLDRYDKYRMGDQAINAILYVLTKYHDIPCKDDHDLYQDLDFTDGVNEFTDDPVLRNVRIFKDDSFSFAFRSASIADKAMNALKNEEREAQYQECQEQIKDIPTTIRNDARDFSNDPTQYIGICNQNIGLDMTKTKRRNREVIELIDHTFARFQVELQAQYQQVDTAQYKDWDTPDTLEKIEAYQHGMIRASTAFSPMSFEALMSDDYPTNSDKVFRNLHRIIGQFAQAVRNQDDSIIYQCAGIDRVIHLVRQSIPQMLQNNEERVATN